MLSLYSSDKIAQLKILRNSQETLDNIAQEENSVYCGLNNIIFRQFLFWIS